MKTFIVIVIVLAIMIGGWWWMNRNAEPVDIDLENISDSLSTDNGVAVRTEEVQYFGTTTGFYAEPESAAGATSTYPGVVMIHEWWGLNDNIRDMAEELASQGYAVLAVDLYGGEVAATTGEAQALVSSLDQEEALENLTAAKQYLTAQGSTKIASLGWCFGGGQSLQFSISGEPLDATVIYYGQLSTSTEDLQAIEWPVLGIFGGADTSIPTTTVEGFRTALTELGIQNDITIYPGVGHAFANPSGMNYAPNETANAWAKTLAFLEANLKQ